MSPVSSPSQFASKSWNGIVPFHAPPSKLSPCHLAVSNVFLLQYLACRKLVACLELGSLQEQCHIPQTSQLANQNPVSAFPDTPHCEGSLPPLSSDNQR